jgi:hypothetical protein
MTSPNAETINEVDFCGKMATAATAFFASLEDQSTFVEVRIEGHGSNEGNTDGGTERNRFRT